MLYLCLCLVQRDYMFNYDIQDGLVGMTHSRGEVQKNGVIRGFYSYSRPDGVLVSVTYTADETGFHPVISEEAVPNLRSASSVHSIYSSDHPEQQIKVTITQDDVLLARQKSEAYAAAAAAAAASASSSLSSSPSSSAITGLKQQFMQPKPSKMRSAQQIFADSFESEQFAAESQDSEHVLYSSIPELARYPKTATSLGRNGAARRFYDSADQ